jgi:hypothetical protein
MVVAQQRAQFILKGHLAMMFALSEIGVQKAAFGFWTEIVKVLGRVFCEKAESPCSTRSIFVLR